MTICATGRIISGQRPLAHRPGAEDESEPRVDEADNPDAIRAPCTRLDASTTGSLKELAPLVVVRLQAQSAPLPRHLKAMAGE